MFLPASLASSKLLTQRSFLSKKQQRVEVMKISDLRLSPQKWVHTLIVLNVLIMILVNCNAAEWNRVTRGETVKRVPRKLLQGQVLH